MNKRELMKIVVEMNFGSHVYGTNVPESDYDYKTIFIPNAKDILLQKADKVSNNQDEKTDHEFIPLKKFIYDAISGQTYALDMLFTPKEHIKRSSPEWEFIIENRSQLLSKNVKPMVGYARAQALKYSLKDERLKALNNVIKRM